MAEAKPPSKVQVGAIPYSVVVDEAAINKACVEERSNRFGQHDPGTQTITLDPKMGSDFAAEVLLHEIVHVTLYHNGTDEDLEPKQLERVCSAVSSQLLDCLRRNPQLVRFLVKEA